MYCIYKEVLGFVGYILGLKDLVSGSSPIFIIVEIFGSTWYSRPRYLLTSIHNKFLPPISNITTHKVSAMEVHQEEEEITNWRMNLRSYLPKT
jgi:hypothetical protein